MISVNEKHIHALCELREDDFTKLILKPLFEAMGFERVDFNGGPYEKGRDLIAQRKLPPRKDLYTVYVQSKKIGNIQNTSTAAKFTTLIHQLRQCCTTGLKNSDGSKTDPSEVYLACPEQANKRFIEEIESQLNSMPVKVQLYDGPRILSDIKEYKPELLALLTDIEEKLLLSNDLKPRNRELLSALKNKSTPSIKNFYSDLSFFVGSFDSNLLLHLKLTIKDNKLNIPEEKWLSLKQEINNIERKHEINILDGNLEIAEAIFLKNKKKYESKTNRNNIEKYDGFIDSINNLNIQIETDINALSSTLNSKINPSINKISDEELEKRQHIVNELKKHNENKPYKITFAHPDSKISFFNDSKSILSQITNKLFIEKESIELQSRIIKKPYYNIEIKSHLIIEKLDFYKKRYFKEVDLINNGDIGLSDLKSFLINTEKSLSFVSTLKNEKFYLSHIFLFNNDEKFQDRVSISPHDIFETGHDIAVYGGAGVGKTTTLDAYTGKIHLDKDTNLFYVSLNRVVDEYRKAYQSSFSEQTFNKDLLIKIILLSKGINPSEENIEDARNTFSKKIILILDGLDEVYNTIPGIITAIAEFKKSHPYSQLIISSRDCVSYLNEINFLGITLLPFTQDQLYKFVRGWFNNSDKSASLIASIKSRNLYEHIKTPLLATITCSLVEKGVNAPSTEHEIYSERLRLLTGEYDLHKNIDRQAQKGEMLRTCAIRIAFIMHTKGYRTLPKHRMLEVLFSSLGEYYTKPLLSKCLNELIDPCNILTKDPITSNYSFGHFRFQEHMAAEELKSNRSIDLAALVTDDWWRGTLCLYAQYNDIHYLVEDVYNKYHTVRFAKITLESMIKNSPQQKREDLLTLFRDYEKADLIDELYLDDDYITDPYDNYEIY